MKEFIRKYKGLIILIFLIFILLISYFMFTKYEKEKLEFYETNTNNLISIARNYIAKNQLMIDSNIFGYIRKDKKVTDGVIYVNDNNEVALAIVYEDDICYTKLYNSNEIINSISPTNCITLINLHVSAYELFDKDENVDIKDEEENDIKENITKPNYNEVIEDEDVSLLYNKYIKNNLCETNNYKDINVNKSNSDEYLVKFAICSILKDNSVDIKNYLYNNGFENGYKITIKLIYQYIKDNFNIERKIDFSKLDLNFITNNDIAYYYFKEDEHYRLISDSSIPKSGAGKTDVYSKLVKYEKNADEIIIYTDFFAIYNSFEMNAMFNNMDSLYSYEDERISFDDTEVVVSIDDIINYYNEAIGHFKHTFKKNNDGNYYWVSTKQIENY